MKTQSSIFPYLPELTLSSLIFVTLFSPSLCLADNDKQYKNGNPVIQKRTIAGVAVTGDNNRFQHAIWDMGPPFGTAFFNWTFAHTPSATEPTLLTEDMPGETILANGLDPVAHALGLGPDPASVTPWMINTPLHEVPISTDPNDFGRGHGTGVRAQLPTTLEAATGAAATRSIPNEPITKSRWYKAEGRLEIKCFADGTAKADLNLSHLIPNGVYTLWTIHGVMIDGNPSIAPYPFGGVPNVVIPDANGRTSTSRTLGYCPLTEQNLVFVDIAFHSDGNVYGAVPDAPFDTVPQAMGSVTHTHLQFPVHVVGPAPQ